MLLKIVFSLFVVAFMSQAYAQKAPVQLKNILCVGRLKDCKMSQDAMVTQDMLSQKVQKEVSEKAQKLIQRKKATILHLCSQIRKNYEENCSQNVFDSFDEKIENVKSKLDALNEEKENNINPDDDQKNKNAKISIVESIKKYKEVSKELNAIKLSHQSKIKFCGNLNNSIGQMCLPPRVRGEGAVSSSPAPEASSNDSMSAIPGLRSMRQLASQAQNYIKEVSSPDVVVPDVIETSGVYSATAGVSGVTIVESPEIVNIREQTAADYFTSEGQAENRAGRIAADILQIQTTIHSLEAGAQEAGEQAADGGGNQSTACGRSLGGVCNDNNGPASEAPGQQVANEESSSLASTPPKPRPENLQGPSQESGKDQVNQDYMDGPAYGSLDGSEINNGDISENDQREPSIGSNLNQNKTGSGFGFNPGSYLNSGSIRDGGANRRGDDPVSTYSNSNSLDYAGQQRFSNKFGQQKNGYGNSNGRYQNRNLNKKQTRQAQQQAQSRSNSSYGKAFVSGKGHPKTSSRNLNLNPSNSSHQRRGRTSARSHQRQGGNKQVLSSRYQNQGSASSGIFGSSSKSKQAYRKKMQKIKAMRAKGKNFDPSKYEPDMKARRRAMARATGRSIASLGQGETARTSKWPKDIHRHKKGSNTNVFNFIKHQYKMQMGGYLQ